MSSHCFNERIEMFLVSSYNSRRLFAQDETKICNRCIVSFCATTMSYLYFFASRLRIFTAYFTRMARVSRDKRRAATKKQQCVIAFLGNSVHHLFAISNKR